MLVFPNAKINLGLFVTEKRPDGYHNLETVFYPVPIYDALELVVSEKDALMVGGLEIAGDDNENLVWKALQALRKCFPDAIPPLSVHLLKSIPMGAGMGGGSADAAFMLKTLNSQFALSAAPEQLHAMALELGSDCPFFLNNEPCFATGRGEILQNINLDLSNYSLQIVFPEVHVSTALAFSGITPKAAPFDLRTLADWPIEDWRHLVVNDFEASVFQQHPSLASLKSNFYEQGALYASMSGSGSTVFAFFPKGKKAVISSSLKQWYFE